MSKYFRYILQNNNNNQHYELPSSRMNIICTFLYTHVSYLDLAYPHLFDLETVTFPVHSDITNVSELNVAIIHPRHCPSPVSEGC